jgi:thymidylate kinase
VSKHAPSPRFYYISGCDGTGKTTQAELLAEHLAKMGLEVRRVWLRFPFLTSVPLLAYARWRRLSWYEQSEGGRYGYWDFQGSRLLGLLLPWTLFLDAFIAATFRIYIPMWAGATIVCERFVIDMLADLMVAFHDHGLAARIPGRLYPLLIPRPATIFVLDLDGETIRQRRNSLRGDSRLEARLAAFRALSRQLGLKVLSTDVPPAQVSKQLAAAGDLDA